MKTLTLLIATLIMAQSVLAGTPDAFAPRAGAYETYDAQGRIIPRSDAEIAEIYKRHNTRPTGKADYFESRGWSGNTPVTQKQKGAVNVKALGAIAAAAGVVALALGAGEAEAATAGSTVGLTDTTVTESSTVSNVGESTGFEVFDGTR